MSKFQSLSTVFVLKDPPKPAYAAPLLFVSDPKMGGNWVECLDAENKQVQVPTAILQNVYKTSKSEEAEALRKKHWPKVTEPGPKQA